MKSEYSYIIEEFTHQSGSKTYKPWLVEKSLFGLITKKYPLIPKFETNKYMSYRYEFYDIEEIKDFKEIEDHRYDSPHIARYISSYPTNDLDYVNDLIAQHKLWMQVKENSKVITKKIIKIDENQRH